MRWNFGALGPRATVAAVAGLSLIALLAVGLSYAVGAGTTASGDVWDVAWQAGALAALAGMLGARRAAAPADRRRWTLWAAAAGCWNIGQALWAIDAAVWRWGSPSPADVFWWGFAVLVIASLLRIPSPSRSVRAIGRSETLPLVGAALALSLALLWHDASRSELAPQAVAAALTYPAVYIAAAVLMLQAMISGALRGTRSTALRLVLAGMAAQAVAFGLWSEQLLDASYVPGRTPLDPLWVVGLICIGVGGAIAARQPEPTRTLSEPTWSGAVLPALVFLGLMAARLLVQFNSTSLGPRLALTAGLLLSGTSLIVRSFLLERGLRTIIRRERAALAALEEREAELAALNVQLVEDSRRDPLTGLRNRRALMEDVGRLEDMRRHGGSPYAIALCDVDHFKDYNDQLGHLAGDQALRTLAQTVRGALREGDVVYRYGGEELILVLRGAEPVAAIGAAERIRLAVSAAALPHPAGVSGRLTVSIGVAAGEGTFAELLERADSALYRAKSGGRDRTEVADGSTRPLTAARSRSAAGETVPRHLRAMMAISRAAAEGRGEPALLQAMGETIRSELSFHIVAVNRLDRGREELRCVHVLGDEEARAALLDTVNPWAEWAPVLESGQHDRGGAVWLPAGIDPGFEQTTVWTSATQAGPDADSWDPEDMLLLPLRASDGEILGVVSVDQPLSGRRPDDEQIAFLMTVADHAALALEGLQREALSSAAATEQSAELQLAAVMLLAETLDLRDPGTARHSRTVGGFALRTAEALGLDPRRIKRIHAAGVLHDLGKLGIADAILFKPGRLSDEEWTEIRRHPEVGARILENAGLQDIASWIRAHHERVDGGGYPAGLRGEQIALEARILAVCDAYEAMIADRPYRAALPATEACAELRRCAGSQFDPVVVEAFIGTLAGPEGADGRPTDSVDAATMAQAGAAVAALAAPATAR